MRALLLAAFAVLLLACSGDSRDSDGRVLAALELPAYEGRWVVINYWAEWCTPCIKEIPELNALDAKYPQVAVLGVNYDGAGGAELEAQLDALGVDFPTLLEEPSARLGIELPRVLPTTLILNPDGVLVQKLVGPQTLETLALATGQVGMPGSEPGGSELADPTVTE